MIQDKVGHRSPVITIMLMLSLPVIFIYAGLGASAAIHILVMILLGITISGPYNLIVGNAIRVRISNLLIQALIFRYNRGRPWLTACTGWEHRGCSEVNLFFHTMILVQAMSTVTGLIDGIGSGGSAIGQFFVPVIQNSFGWEWVFYLFIVMVRKIYGLKRYNLSITIFRTSSA